MKNTPIHYGLLLATITLLLFFAVYYFGIGFNYYSISVKMNAFLLPAVYTLAAVILLYKKTNQENLTFINCFKNSFLTMFIGGTLSFLAIIFFFNYIDRDAQTLLLHQRLAQNIESIHQEYKSITNPTQEQTENYHALLKSMNSESAKNDVLFSFKKSFIILGILYSFYLAISLFLSIFFRTRNPHATLNSHTPAK